MNCISIREKCIYQVWLIFVLVTTYILKICTRPFYSNKNPSFVVNDVSKIKQAETCICFVYSVT